MEGIVAIRTNSYDGIRVLVLTAKSNSNAVDFIIGMGHIEVMT
jgi:hypothetical protein